ncbi:hypothetical protein [Arsenophonus sp.]
MKMAGKKHCSIDGIKSFIKANIWLKSKYLFLAEKTTSNDTIAHIKSYFL